MGKQLSQKGDASRGIPSSESRSQRTGVGIGTAVMGSEAGKPAGPSVCGRQREEDQERGHEIRFSPFLGVLEEKGC